MCGEVTLKCSFAAPLVPCPPLFPPLQASAAAAAASVAAIEERLALLKAQLRAAEGNLGRADAAAQALLSPQKGPSRGGRRPSIQG